VSIGAGPRSGFRWTPELIVYAIDLHHRRHLKLPSKRDWVRAGEDHPSLQTVRRAFGSWSAAVAAAGFRPRGPGGARFVTRARCSETGRWLPAASPFSGS
jgi:Homing endonuclease associated repeat